MHSSPRLTLLAFVTLSAAAPHASAQSGFDAERSFAVLETSTFGASVAGDFTGDGRTDVVVIADDEPLLLFGPDAYRGPAAGRAPSGSEAHALVVPIHEPDGAPEAVWDLAVFENVGPDEVDALFTVGENGLIRWRWIDAAWERTPILGPWVQAGTDLSRVATFEYEDTGFTWVSVLEEDGLTLRTLLFLRSSGNFFSQLGAVTLGANAISSLELANLDGDAQPEVVTVSAGGVEVWKVNGTKTTTIPDGTSAVTLDEPGARDRLAFVSESQGIRLLFTVDVLPEPDPIAPTGSVQALAAGDADGDGFEDVLVVTDGSAGSGSEPRFLVYTNRRVDDSDGPTLSALNTLSLSPSAGQAPDVPTLADRVLFGDLEDDGDGDVLVWNGSTSLGLHFRANAVDRSSFAPERRVDVGPPGFEGTFPFEISVTALPSPLPGGVTHVEAVAWAVDATGSIQSTAEDVDIVPVVPEALPDDLVLDLGIPPVDGTFLWSIELRLVDDSGSARRVFPSALNTLEVEVEYPHPDPRRGLPFAAGVPELRGQFLPLTDLPPFPEEEVPIVPIPFE